MNKILIFIKNQLEGNDVEDWDSVKMTWRMVAKDSRMKAGVLLRPVDLVERISSNKFCIPLIVISRDVLGEKDCVACFGVWLCSCVYAPCTKKHTG